MLSILIDRSDLPLCSELSEIEIEFGEECFEPMADINDWTRDLVIEKFVSQIWISTNVSLFLNS